MKTYDAVVVGGGPAGATAAYWLARQGWEVLLLEKNHFPRHKPCGGALSPKAYGQLDFDISDLVKARVRRIKVRGPGQVSFPLKSRDLEVWMVSRGELDLRLLDQASQAGARVHQGEPVEVILEGGQVVGTARGEYRARALVGADGCQSLVARSLSLGSPRPQRLRGLHLEGPLQGEPQEEAILDFAHPGGFAWSFPKGSLVNVGICTREKGWDLRPRLESFLRREGLALASPTTWHSWLIPLGGSFRPLHQGSALLVGDAAGLADPLLGEGIAYAIKSAHLAAAAINGYLRGEFQDLATYSETIRRTLHRDLRPLGLGAACLYRLPRLFLALLRASPRLQALVSHIVSGRKSPSGLWAAGGPK